VCEPEHPHNTVNANANGNANTRVETILT
jgi:hypothetical protein